MIGRISLSLAMLGFLFSAGTVCSQAELELRKGDRICLVGNALGERMQHHNYFEALLHQRFADKELTVRNLCFPGDEAFQRERSENFGSPDDHLKHSRASVILFFFGFNESFAGDQGLAKFESDIRKLVKETKTKKYDGQASPRIAFISPIAFENTGDPNLPNGEVENKRLVKYVAVLKKVARETNVSFADWFTPSLAHYQKSNQRQTLNGSHLSDEGYRNLAPLFVNALFGPSDYSKTSPELLKTIDDKNFHWWHRYRAVNGFSIYGKRGLAGKDGSNTYNNRDVMERERAILDQMTANRDQRIWLLASGKKNVAAVDDSNTLPFFEPTTNVGGANDVNRKRGKLGSLDYLSADKQQKLFKLPKGYKISLVATEEEIPELANPVAINFDSKGRLWVATMPSYPHWKPKTRMDDKLIILTDKDADGRMDGCKVFAGGLHQPTGFELGHGGVFVAQQPDVLFLKDNDGDDQADQRIRKLVGFDSADSHHGLAAFEWGPGGGLYFQEGTFKFSQVESPYGLTRMSEAGIWRYDPRTEKFEAHVSFAFANPWGHVFDRFGQNFIADASPGFNYWATPISGHVVHPDKHTGGSQYRRINPGRLKKQGDYPRFIVKRTRPSSGCEFLVSSHFPPEFQNNFLVNNVIGERSILNHTVHEDGSGFGGKEVERLVFCEDGNFRPVDLQMGPDGALYICDWHNALIGHLQHNLRDPSRDHSHGRIWKLTYEGRPLVKPPQIAGAPIGDLLNLLSVYEDRTRYRVKRELAARDSKKVIAGVIQWVKSLDKDSPDYERMLLEALWQHQTHNAVEEVLLQRVMQSPDPKVRAAATRVACFWRDQLENPLATIARSIRDKHPRVRLEAVRACSFIISEESLSLALDVLNQETDRWLDYAIEETVRTLTTQLGQKRMLAHREKMKHQTEPKGDHAHHQMSGPEPVVFLDKSKKVVRFQLDRLTDAEISSIGMEGRKNPVVCLSIAARENVAEKDRMEAIRMYAKATSKSQVDAILDAMQYAGNDKSAAGAHAKLAVVLSRLPEKVVAEESDRMKTLLGTVESSFARQGLFGALISQGEMDSCLTVAGKNAANMTSFLDAIPLVTSAKARQSCRATVVEQLKSGQRSFGNRQGVQVVRAAIRALSHIESKQDESFELIADLIGTRSFKKEVVSALLRIPSKQRDAKVSQLVAATLLKQAESTPAKNRTTPDFLNAAELTSQLISAFPKDQAKLLRKRLRAVAVRVVRIHTVEEEMRYDIPYFAVEAGRPVQLVLINEDLMPHNLVITQPEKLKEVAELAGQMGPSDGAAGKQYVPQSNLVLQSTGMVPARKSETLTFKAPTEPGEYPFVCTFPRHWMRMYGVMVVVKDLDAWQKNPVPPKDPIGSNRAFVKKWSIDDFSKELANAPQTGSETVGKKLFTEATCAQCHKLGGEGGAVGPDLSGVFAKFKNDRKAVLTEILDPSNKIEPKYEVHLVQTFDGLSVSGIITKQNAREITLISNPENPKPTTLLRDDIEGMKKMSSSLMPKALLDNYQKAEIIELLNYIQSHQTADAKATGK